MTGIYDFEVLTGTVRDKVAREGRGCRTAEDLGAVMGEVTALAEAELERHLPPGEREAMACAAGCGSCCVLNVAVLFPEGVAIAHYLRGLEPSVRRGVEERLSALYPRVCWLDDEERIFLRQSCAFLDEEGACTIHPVRPLLCRSVTSTDPEACRQALDLDPFGECQTVLMNIFQKSLMDAVFRGVAEGLEVLGLDPRGGKLTVVVKALLDDPERVGRYLAGGSVPAG